MDEKPSNIASYFCWKLPEPVKYRFELRIAAEHGPNEVFKSSSSSETRTIESLDFSGRVRRPHAPLSLFAKRKLKKFTETTFGASSQQNMDATTNDDSVTNILYGSSATGFKSIKRQLSIEMGKPGFFFDTADCDVGSSSNAAINSSNFGSDNGDLEAIYCQQKSSESANENFRLVSL